MNYYECKTCPECGAIGHSHRLSCVFDNIDFRESGAGYYAENRAKARDAKKRYDEFQPTMNLQYRKHSAHSNWGPPRTSTSSVLQQEWIHPDGSKEWRDIKGALDCVETPYA